MRIAAHVYGGKINYRHTYISHLQVDHAVSDMHLLQMSAIGTLIPTSFLY